MGCHESYREKHPDMESVLCEGGGNYTFSPNLITRGKSSYILQTFLGLHIVNTAPNGTLFITQVSPGKPAVVLRHELG